jgi:Fic family protein
VNRGLQGRWLKTSAGTESFRAFLPAPLPPRPEIRIDFRLQDLLGRANRALGRLDGITTLLPEPSLFLYFYVRKEALFSSQIEGTQSSLSDLLLFESQETPGVPLADVREVSNYVAALDRGIELLRSSLPLSLRLIREIHKVLLSKGRGSEKGPGEFRRTQNWVGGTRPGNAQYVPPPPGEIMACLGALEKYLNDKPAPTPVLIKAALAHVQFESIHPFLDGNGRLGRLLITLLLVAEGAIREPLLYLSLFFKQNRNRYYELLQQVRLDGDWEAWLEFFLEGVVETSEKATETTTKILDRFDTDRTKIAALGRSTGSALRLHDLLRRRPLLTIAAATRELGLSAPTVGSSFEHLVRLGIVNEVTGRRRDRMFAYTDYLAILAEGAEPIR